MLNSKDIARNMELHILSHQTLFKKYKNAKSLTIWGYFEKNVIFWDVVVKYCVSDSIKGHKVPNDRK